MAAFAVLGRFRHVLDSLIDHALIAVICNADWSMTATVVSLDCEIFSGGNRRHGCWGSDWSTRLAFFCLNITERVAFPSLWFLFREIHDWCIWSRACFLPPTTTNSFNLFRNRWSVVVQQIAIRYLMNGFSFFISFYKYVLAGS